MNKIIKYEIPKGKRNVGNIKLKVMWFKSVQIKRIKKGKRKHLFLKPVYTL